jgi:cell division protease FtsH
MPGPSPRGSIHWPTVALFFGFIVLTLAQSFLLKAPLPKSVSYSELLALAEADKLEEVQIREHDVVGKLKATAKPKPPASDRVEAERIPGHDPAELLASLKAHGVKISGRPEESAWWEPLVFGWILPIGLLFGLWTLAQRRMQKRGGPLSFGRSRVKIYDRTATERVTFEDVAGVDEAEGELIEVVDFLRNPQKYQALGARIPKGVLLLGPPGTGKTLLARAVAGEAGVAFFSISGSEFVDMFVGVGAARIRDLFEQAKGRAPCIVFIDELDALGKSRGGLAALGTNDEREQTLNQLLVEMDGFDASSGVVLMAATNRPEVLDAALMRAGRFDRQVLVDRPDLRGREEILRVHVRKIKLADEVDLKLIAQRTPGMVGADLANLVNEAALAAARNGEQRVSQKDLEEAIDRIQLGLKKKNRAMSEEEKRRVAYHESGHALVALSMRHADPVHRVTIIPRSIGALGATLQVPAEERYMMTREELFDRICVMLGGRAAEEVVFSDVSTGAQNDLERVAETARQMVCRFGMSHDLGPLAYGRARNLRFLDGLAAGEERNFSEQTAQAIDREVRAIVDDAYRRARSVLEQKKSALEAIAQRLLQIETLERSELEALARG